MNDIVKHAIAAYGFLLPLRQNITSQDFAQLIKGYSAHGRSDVVALNVEETDFMFLRKNDGSIECTQE
jgi:hypothetical protein